MMTTNFFTVALLSVGIVTPVASQSPSPEPTQLPTEEYVEACDGWCGGGSDIFVGSANNLTECWSLCEDYLGDDLVAVDWWFSYGNCYCQDDCDNWRSCGSGEYYDAAYRVGANVPDDTCTSSECGYDDDSLGNSYYFYYYYDDWWSYDDQEDDDDGWRHTVMYDGETSSYGDDLSQTVPLRVWNNKYYLYIDFTMPGNLSDISNWDGLLGSDDGGHPYPYFCIDCSHGGDDGLYFERQNGPHPNKERIDMDFFNAGQNYTIAIYFDGDGWYEMWIVKSTADDDGYVDWMYDFDFTATPAYVGCGYEPGSESFAGSVSHVALWTMGDDNEDESKDDSNMFGTVVGAVFGFTTFIVLVFCAGYYCANKSSQRATAQAPGGRPAPLPVAQAEVVQAIELAPTAVGQGAAAEPAPRPSGGYEKHSSWHGGYLNALTFEPASEGTEQPGVTLVAQPSTVVGQGQPATRMVGEGEFAPVGQPMGPSPTTTTQVTSAGVQEESI